VAFHEKFVWLTSLSLNSVMGDRWGCGGLEILGRPEVSTVTLSHYVEALHGHSLWWSSQLK
jgi:hypothetical protein